MRESVFSLRTKLIVFVINFFTLVLIGLFLYFYQSQSLEKKFKSNIENIIVKEFSNSISAANGVITSLSSFYQSSSEVNTSSFSLFANDLLNKYNFMDGIAFLSLVNHEDRVSFEEQIREEGLYNFKITSLDKKKNKFILSEKREKYGPIVYMAPSSYKYTRYYGFDIYNDELFNDLFLKSSKNNSIEIKDRFKNERNEMTSLFVKATYNGHSLNNENNRLESTNGFYLINIDIDKILIGLIHNFPEYNIRIISEPEYEEIVSSKPFDMSNLLRELTYYKKIDSFHNSHFYITRQLKYSDFNLSIFFIVMFLVMVIQVLYILIWHKDKVLKLRLKFKAYHDDLTGLSNRSFFKKAFNLRVNKANSKMAILFIDVDRFKEVNDSFGHKFGDDVLIELANRFKSIMRDKDVISRHSGDEFIILVDGIDKIDDIINIVKKIMNKMNEPIHHNSNNIYLTLSIGISLYPSDASNIDDLLKNADSALYKAKDEGRNTFKFYTEDMTLKVMQKVVLENKLRDAIKNDEFIVYYQPQYNGVTNKLIGMEALVRWKDKDGNFIFPNSFIPLAEETGLIISLDQLVMKKAIKEFTSWDNKGLNPMSLSLNLSMKQLKSNNFISMMKEVLIMNNCNPSKIELEVTEGQIMENPLESIEKLKEISSFGIKLSVDDFGTGYSSLAYLKKLPIKKLKIDRAFVKDLPSDEEDVAISKSIIALSQNLKLDVIAEGVETLEQKEFLIKNGCSKIQGYFYSKPLSSKDMEDLLKSF